MKEEKGKWEKLIHSILYDFEADVSSEDWELIADRLPGGRSVRLYTYRRYVAAAVIAALLTGGGSWIYLRHHAGQDAVIVAEGQTETAVRDTVVKDPSTVEKNGDVFADGGAGGVSVDIPAEKKRVPVKRAVGEPAGRKAVDRRLIASTGRLEARDPVLSTTPSVRLKPLKIDESASAFVKKTGSDAMFSKDLLIADASAEVKPRRRWGFGMGGGSYSVNTSSVNTAPATRSLPIIDDETTLKEAIHLNNVSKEEVAYRPKEELKTHAYEIPSGKVKHKMPLSAGLGVSYFLSDRWSLQSGITYTFLRSEWNTDRLSDEYKEYKQHLHFLGIPLAVSYRIAEWNRFQFYASAGGLYELNVAGKYKESEFSENLKKTSNRNIRMKEPVWSVNTRAGVAYPLCRFINAYAEAGASYYFENQSAIETIRSDKPFNVSLQAGFRFGF
jgi:opacity protein-like surface antigen